MKRIYICSSCRPENYEYVKQLLKLYTTREMSIFHPEPQQLEEKTRYACVDIIEIQKADEIWLIGDYGRDCSWELGYAQALQKTVCVFRCHINRAKLDDDWMLWPLMHACNVYEVPHESR